LLTIENLFLTLWQTSKTDKVKQLCCSW